MLSAFSHTFVLPVSRRGKHERLNLSGQVTFSLVCTERRVDGPNNRFFSLAYRDIVKHGGKNLSRRTEFELFSRGMCSSQRRV